MRAYLTEAEASALREVARVMREQAQELPDESRFGKQLWNGATRLALLFGENPTAPDSTGAERTLEDR
jgi:hypothetical protein